MDNPLGPGLAEKLVDHPEPRRYNERESSLGRRPRRDGIRLRPPYRRQEETMRTASLLRHVLVIVALTAAGAWAHPQDTIDLTLPPNEAGQQGGLYYWSAAGAATIWQETNTKIDGGMFAWPDGRSHVRGTKVPVTGTDVPARPDGRNVLGLQIHNACYGTFPSACDPAKGCQLQCNNRVPGPDCLNCHHQGIYLFTYLPWGYFANGRWVDGSKADCEAWGGQFVTKDTIRYQPPDYPDGYTDALLVSHNGTPASQCFPTGYGRKPVTP
jgi:hypothetical protein